jgi:predicted ATP-dependent endonuclease of OLD family
MKLLDLQLHNFRKLSNLPQPTIAFNQDINVLVGANNAGKTSILKAIQKLFGTEAIDVNRDANYLVKDGNLIVEGTIKLSLEQWKSFLRIASSFEPQISLDSLNLDSLAEELFTLSAINLSKTVLIANGKQLNLKTTAKFEASKQLDEFFEISHFLADKNVKDLITNALSHFADSDLYNVYKTPLYLDSKGSVLERETVTALNQIESNPTQHRGLLYSLKKKEPTKFNEFKQRLLEIFTEIEDIDVINNEEVNEFQLVIHEKLRNNGDTKSVKYDINNVGQGMQTLVIMLSTILLLKPSIVLMDEPEVHMHPSLIKEFVGYIKKLSVETQFIMTTHSEVLINEVGLDKVFYLENDIEQKGIIVTKVDDKNRLLEAVNSLGYNVDSSAYTIKPSVFVFTEGPSDKDFILAFAKKANLENQINSFNTAFIEMGGKGNRYKFASLIDKLNKDYIESPIVMILDRDETSNTSIEEIRINFFSKNQNRLHYLSKRQIENYLIDENAIKTLVKDKIEKAISKNKKETADLERWNAEDLTSKVFEIAETQKEKILNNFVREIFITQSLVGEKQLDSILDSLKEKKLNEAMQEFWGKVGGQIFHKSFDLQTNTTTVLENFEKEWNTANNKIEMCEGRELLKDIRTWIKDEYRVSFDDNEIIEAMEDVPEEIMSLLIKLTKPEDLKIESGN